MKHNTMLEQDIKQAMHTHANCLNVSVAAEQRMWAKIEQLQQEDLKKERYKMKKFSVKLVATVCAVFAFSAVSVLAAGGVLSGWVGGNIYGTDVASYTAMENKLLPQLDYSPNVTAEFANGYKFDKANLGKFTAMDENHNAFGPEYTSLDVRYTVADGLPINLSISNEPQVTTEPLSGEPTSVTRTVGDVVLSYQAMPYKFVPPGYELSEDEQALSESGALQISVGSDEVEETICCGVTWRANDVNYYLFGWDLQLGAEAMLDMAEELLAQ